MVHAAQTRVAAGRATCRGARPWALSRSRWALAYRRRRSRRLGRGCSPPPSTVGCAAVRHPVTHNPPPAGVAAREPALLAPAAASPTPAAPAAAAALGQGNLQAPNGGDVPNAVDDSGNRVENPPGVLQQRDPDPFRTNEEDDDDAWGDWGGHDHTGPVLHGARPAGVPDDFGSAAPPAASWGARLRPRHRGVPAGNRGGRSHSLLARTFAPLMRGVRGTLLLDLRPRPPRVGRSRLGTGPGSRRNLARLRPIRPLRRRPTRISDRGAPRRDWQVRALVRHVRTWCLTLV